MNKKSYILIIGGELRNKGAQAMSFIVVEEMKKRFPELTPVLISDGDASPNVLERLKGKKRRKDLDSFTFPIKRSVNTERIASIKRVLKRVVFFRSDVRNIKYYKDAAFCVDISGFAFGKKWGYDACVNYLRRLELILKYNTPVFLLPQSFGPFDFEEDKQTNNLRHYANHILPKVKKIYAREQDGYEKMIELCPSAHIVKRPDIVLQNRELDLKYVFQNQPDYCSHIPKSLQGNVGIVPNMRNYDHGNSSILDKMYKEIVSLLLDKGKNVCLIRHASEDLEICSRIKSWFAEDNRVEIYGEDRYCFEYELLFERCDFLIASRFHSIVHAYKCTKPCIAIGWAVKYYELLDSVGQAEYVFDVSSPDFEPNSVLNAVAYFVDNSEALKPAIQNAVSKAQCESIFDEVEQEVRAILSDKVDK